LPVGVVTLPYDRPVLAASDAERIAGLYDLGGSADLVGPVARGHQGAIWRLTTDRGSWAVKELGEPRVEEDLAATAAFEEAVAAAGVLVPTLCRTGDGRVLGDVGEAQVRVHGWVDLRDPDPTIDPSAVGTAVARIHGVGLPGDGVVDPWYSEIVGEETWRRLAAELQAARAPFADRLEALLDETVAVEALVRPHRELQLCHGDLFADNVRLAGNGRVCVFDWEDSSTLDPAYELAVVLFEFARSDARRVRDLCDSYVDAGGQVRITEPGDFSMAITQMNHLGEIACRRWLDAAPGSEVRSVNEVRVAEYVDSPLTRRVIDDLLVAIDDAMR
jgi:Ser/Thr protein kinase RdoA (MazF antagonist)